MTAVAVESRPRVDVGVSRLTQANEVDVQDLNTLIGFLSRQPFVKDLDHLQQLLDSSSRLYVAKHQDRIVGMTILHVLYYWGGSTGVKGWVDDVVVHPDYRGLGIANRIHALLLEEAPEDMALTDLSVKNDEDHVPARAMYEKLGYEARGSLLMRRPIER